MDEVELKGIVHVKHGSCLRLQVVVSGEISKHNTSHSYAPSHTGKLYMSFSFAFTLDLPEIYHINMLLL